MSKTGLVDGKKIFLDSSLIEANASNNSILDTRSLKGQLSARYGERERRLSKVEPGVLADRGIAAHMPDLKRAAIQRTQSRQIFPDTAFVYDPASDTYRCPAGQRLKRKSLHQNRDSIDYAAPKKVCEACALRAQCTRNKSGRTIKRHLRQQALDSMREASRSPQAKRDIHIRPHLMERSFARAARYGFDRARWRALWRVAIQEYLTAAIQNIEVLIRYESHPQRWTGAMQREIKERYGAVVTALCNGLLLRRNLFASGHTAAIHTRL